MPKGVNNNRGLVNFNKMREELKSRLEYMNGRPRGVRRLAEKIGIPPSTLSKFLAAGGMLTTDNVTKVIKFVGKPLEYFAGMEAPSLKADGKNTLKTIRRVLDEDPDLTPQLSGLLFGILASSYKYVLEENHASHTDHKIAGPSQKGSGQRRDAVGY